MVFPCAFPCNLPPPTVSVVSSTWLARRCYQPVNGFFEEPGIRYLDEEIQHFRDSAILDSRGQPFKLPAKAPEMHLTSPVYEEIMEALMSRPPEAGGLLLGPKNHHAVTHFYLDETARACAVSFTLDHHGMNRVLQHYKTCGIDAKGIVHSHPNGCHAPSNPDLEYVQQLFRKPKNATVTEFFLPIVCGGLFHPYVITRNNDQGPAARALPAKLVLF